VISAKKVRGTEGTAHIISIYNKNERGKLTPILKHPVLSSKKRRSWGRNRKTRKICAWACNCERPPSCTPLGCKTPVTNEVRIKTKRRRKGKVFAPSVGLKGGNQKENCTKRAGAHTGGVGTLSLLGGGKSLSLCCFLVGVTGDKAGTGRKKVEYRKDATSVVCGGNGRRRGGRAAAFSGRGECGGGAGKKKGKGR